MRQENKPTFRVLVLEQNHEVQLKTCLRGCQYLSATCSSSWARRSYGSSQTKECSVTAATADTHVRGGATVSRSRRWLALPCWWRVTLVIIWWTVALHEPPPPSITGQRMCGRLFAHGPSVAFRRITKKTGDFFLTTHVRRWEGNTARDVKMYPFGWNISNNKGTLLGIQVEPPIFVTQQVLFEL